MTRDDPVAGFRSALERVPRVLLSREDERVLTDAFTSAEVLENLVYVPTFVVIVGGSGVGKSHLANALCGGDFTQTDVLRPTTRSIVMAGSIETAAIPHGSDYVVVPGAPTGIVFVDTPPWEFDTPAVEAALIGADAAILVVSPSRYGDASTRALWDAMASVPITTVVLNRLVGSDAERAELVSGACERLGISSLITVDENGGTDTFVDEVLETVSEIDADVAGAKEAVVRAAARKVGRHVAGLVTTAAVDLGRLSMAIENVGPVTIPASSLAVHESWLATQQGLIGHVEKAVADTDAAIIDACEAEIAQRLFHRMRSWDSARLRESLDHWRIATTDRFRSVATIRWRRSSFERVLDQASWKLGVNIAVTVPGRVARCMGSEFASVVGDVHEELVGICDREVMYRTELWRSCVDAAGDFKPGELLAASDEVGRL